MSVASKRAFLYRVFYPLGSSVCAALGMPPPSADVDDAEFFSAHTRMGEIPDSFVLPLIERARWVADGIANTEQLVPIDVIGEIGEGRVECPDCGEESVAITLQEILVKFYMAMKLEECDGQLVR